MVAHFNESNFNKEVLEASKTKPVLVDFFAAWCGPCRMQGPIIEEVAKEIGENAIIGKMDIEESDKLAQEFNVMSIPTLMIFKNEKPIEILVGLQSKDYLIDLLKKYK